MTIAAPWYITLHEESTAENFVTPIASKADLERFQRTYTSDSLRSGREAPMYIPTGIVIQSVGFSTANNVVLTGYIWQHCQGSYHGDLSQGIVMPEAETVEIEEADRREDNGDVLFGWYFRVTLRQNFD